MTIICMMLLILLVIVVIISGVICFKKNKGLTFVISVLVIILISGAIYLLNFYENHISVKSLNNKNFTINIKNHRQKYEYYYEDFSCNYSFDELFKKVQDEYNAKMYNNTTKEIAIVYDNNIYTIADNGESNLKWMGMYNYKLLNNVVSIDIKGSNYDIPFPVNTIDSSVEVYSKTLKVNCDFQIIKDYYSNFSNVNFSDNTISFSVDGLKYDIVYNKLTSEITFNVD